MKISLITVVYNNEHTIEDAIKSVLSQTYQDKEFIIVDGQSTDNTPNIIEKYRGHFDKFISGKDKSNYDAYNKGLKLASGNIIGFLNSDDIYSSDNIIEEVMDVFYKYPEIDMVYGDLVYVKKNNTDIVVRHWISQPNYHTFFEDGNVPPHPTLFIRKEVYDQIGNFDITFKLAADYEFMLRAFRIHRYKAHYINKVFVKMRLGGKTNKSLENIFKGNLDILNAWRKHRIKPPFLFFPKRILKRLQQF